MSGSAPPPPAGEPPDAPPSDEGPSRPGAAALALLVLRRAAANFLDDRALHLAAGVAYFALVSLFPILLLAFSAFGLVLRDLALRRRILDALVDGLPVHSPIVEDALASLAGGGATIGAAALVGAVWAASALAASMRAALAVVFGVERERPFLRARLIDIAVAPALGLLLLLSLALTTGWRVAQAEAGDLGVFSRLTPLWEAGAIAIAGAMSFLAFLLLYRVLPHVPGLRLRLLWPAALLAAALFEGFKLGFAFYLANFSNYDVVYGSLGGAVALLVWVYASAVVLLFGAEVAAELPYALRGEARRAERQALRDAGRVRKE